MLSLLINLAESKERLSKINCRLAELGLNFERIEAINGKLLSQETKDLLTYPFNHFESKVRFTRELTDGEIGCFLSHRKCWERLLSSNENFALILEDDIEIADIAVKYMNNDSWIPPSVEICQLSCLEAKQKGRINNKIITIDNFLQLVEPIYPIPLGTQCYIISRKVAKKALSLSERLPCPVDNFLFSPWFYISNKHTIWRTTPTLVIPKQNILSTIGNRDKTSVKKAPFFIRHGLTRMIMDHKIKHKIKKGTPFTFRFIGTKC